jgi:uncharacterized membrane protein YtjA (UPF0391 family)
MVRTFALVFGIIYLLVGILGFTGLATAPPAGDAHHNIQFGHSYLLGLFPVNTLHNIVHLIIGLWGLLASRSVSGARLYAKVLAIAYGLLAIMGIIPSETINTTFGLIPIYGHDVWLHALSALIAAYFGFVARDDGTPARAD